MKDNSPALLFQGSVMLFWSAYFSPKTMMVYDSMSETSYFADDGGGMNPELIRKCMSLGYSSKKSNKTIGQCNSFITQHFITFFLDPTVWLISFIIFLGMFMLNVVDIVLKWWLIETPEFMFYMISNYSFMLILICVILQMATDSRQAPCD